LISIKKMKKKESECMSIAFAAFIGILDCSSCTDSVGWTGSGDCAIFEVLDSELEITSRGIQCLHVLLIVGVSHNGERFQRLQDERRVNLWRSRKIQRRSLLQQSGDAALHIAAGLHHGHCAVSTISVVLKLRHSVQIALGSISLLLRRCVFVVEELLGITVVFVLFFLLLLQ